MRIGMIDVDGHNFPNLALMKLSAWHRANGDTVGWYDHMAALTGKERYGRVYMSKVFDATYTDDYPYVPVADRIIRGGTGYSLTGELPYEIEHMTPDYPLYGITDTAYGFLTRGCPRHCSFCVVGDKEGLTPRKVADLTEFWSGQENVEILDPNLLACRDRMELLEQLVDSRAMVNINQGLDICLTNEEVADALGRMRVKRLHFAWDNPDDDLAPYFERFHGWYRRKSSATKVVYVLVNHGSTLEQDLHRIYTLRDLHYDPYVMVFDKPHAPLMTIRLQRWVNNRFIFRKCERFEDYAPVRREMERNG